MKLSNILLTILAGSAVILLAHQIRRRQDGVPDDLDEDDLYRDYEDMQSMYPQHPIFKHEDRDHPLFV
ncbi:MULTISPECIES: hypothetical protein [unclassified Flavobacterium]|uniref:hypothetical protein n=1 Tax=unclassified Flavobacterium TaxID=196869 RepID=UPI001F142BD0|nr:MULTISPECIES: hypothetical protein [unclassified Flavobacterium]UMY64991.1 hypothetical protein MKO97_10760 [Flavobacterium sp. HJ-32-4]